MVRNGQRLRVGSLELLPAGRNADRQQMWAFPGGARATFGEIAEHARRQGWPRPVVIGFPEKRTRKGAR